LKISGLPIFRASLSAWTQKSESSVLDSDHDSTKRLYQSVTANLKGPLEGASKRLKRAG
jgi:hypothetical protein